MVKIVTFVAKGNKILASLLLLVSACGVRERRDGFSLERRPYHGDQLKLNGYYYTGSDLSPHVRVLYFYRNGVLLSMGAVDKDSLDARPRLLADSSLVKWAKGHADNWGVFQIRGDTIMIEMWNPGTMLQDSHLKKGKIVNDSVFFIDSIERVGTSETWKWKQIYKYRATEFKPDSSNDFTE